MNKDLIVILETNNCSAQACTNRSRKEINTMQQSDKNWKIMAYLKNEG